MEKLKLSGFDVSKSEKATITELIETYENKFEREANYQQLSLRLKKSQQINNVLYEVETKLDINGKIFNAKVTDYNMFVAVSTTLNKILNELKHYQKK